MARALSPRLAARGIAVEARRPLPELDDAARALCAHMLDLDVLPLTASAPTWRGWGLSSTQCRAFFFAAARFRRAAPWKRVGDEPFQVFGHHGPWTAAVMGSGGAEFGLCVYTDPQDFEALFTDRFDANTTLERTQGAMISVSFEPRGEITREMQKEVAAAGWDVADPAGFPVVFTTNTPAGGLDPTVADAVADILLTIPDFLDARADEIVARRLRDGPASTAPFGVSDADVDIGVRPQRGTPFDVGERVGLTLALEELLGVDRVDLVVLPEVGAFLALAVVSGELLYCADPTGQAEYELYVLRRAGDLEPFERERRELILREGAR